MEPEDAQFGLERDIVTWLKTAPQKADLLTYAGALPDDQDEQLYDATSFLLRNLGDSLFKYWKQNGLEKIDQLLTVSDQFELLNNLSEYNPNSVVLTMVKKYPDFPTTGWTGKESAWSKTFLSQFDSALRLRSAKDYMLCRTFLTSVLNTPELYPILPNLQAELEQLTLQESQAIESGTYEQNSAQWKDFYKSLVFLPADECERLGTLEAYLDRTALNDRLLRILFLINPLTNDSVSRERLDEALWETYLVPLMNSVLATWEGSRSARIGSVLEPFYEQFLTFWSPKNIQAELSASLTFEAFKPLFNTGKMNVETLLDSLASDLYIETIVDPYPSELLINNLENCKTQVDYQQQLSDVKEVLIKTEGDVELAEKLLAQLYTLITQLHDIRP